MSFAWGIVQRGSLQMTKVDDKKITTIAQADSVMNLHNKKLRENLKFIYTEGLPGIDNKLPLYNDKGVEAAVAFDNKKVYTCEMAIDLQLLGLDARSGDKFAYHVVINGEPYKYVGMRSFGGGGNPGQDKATSTTDLWGEYILAK
jgi:hypothetical protein